MTNIEIPPYLRSKLCIDREFACRLVDVELNDGRVYRRLHLCGISYITGSSDCTEGGEGLPFSSLDIANVQGHAFAFGRPGAF